MRSNKKKYIIKASSNQKTVKMATSIKKKFTVKASCGKKSIKSAKDTSVSSDAVREVALWIENDENMYRQYIQPNINDLRKKIKSGKYNPELAMKVWRRIADTGTKEYDKKYGSNGGKLFLNKATREEIAKSLMENFDEELNYDEVTSATIVANSEDEGKYLIENFYQDNFRGLADYAYADDYDSAVDIAHEFICHGGSVSITNMENGRSARYTYDDYFDGFEGESPFNDAENDAMWSDNITSATDIEETEDDYITALADGTLGMIKANSDLEDAEYELSDAAITFIINGDNVYVQPIEEIVPNWDDLDSDATELSNAVIDEIFN